MIPRRWRCIRLLPAVCRRFVSVGCLLVVFLVVFLLSGPTDQDRSRGVDRPAKRRNSRVNPDKLLPQSARHKIQDVHLLGQDDLLEDGALVQVPANGSYRNVEFPSFKQKTVATKSSFEQDAQSRLHTYTQFCSRQPATSSDFRSFLVADPDMKMAYCFVAKIACTFWLRIFTFLTRPHDMRALHISSPSEINRAALHWGQLMPKPRFSLQDFQAVSKVSTVKFLFARNPYERLWSVYLDKYYLPDYWLFQPLGASKCGVNTTFTQFLNHAFTSQDHHVIPVSQACNPCRYQPDVVGKMDTFSREAKHILNTSGFGHLMKDANRSSYVEAEIKTLVGYNFKLPTVHGLTSLKCLTSKSLSQRLWRVFQINGHLKSDSLFPDTLSDYSMKNVIEVFLKVASEDSVTSEQAREQRRKSIIEAYATIPPSLIEGIRLRYQDDFAMFDYSPHPPT